MAVRTLISVVFAVGLVLAHAGLSVRAGYAQSAPSSSERSAPVEGRLRVGLVLSGGAAKGVAHIGAIQVLEEAGLPIDIVTGTSMGSVVGGLYAIGYTPEMMTQIIGEQDWTTLLTDATPRSALDIERRVESGETLLSVPVQGGGVTLPSGVVQGQRILELLARLTWPYHGVDDFMQLPRPYAALVMDLRTGEAVRLTSGSLPLAIRASMSIPTLFEPVEIDGRTFVDGGLVRNLPAQDALDLGADVLVCVDVGETPPEAEGFSPGSLLNIVLRATFLRGEASTQEERQLCDILIEPEAGDLGYFTFNEAEAWTRRGDMAARAVLPQVQALVERLGRPAVAPVPIPEINAAQVVAIDVQGASAAGEELVRKRLDLAIPSPFTPDLLRDAVERVYTSGAFERVAYQVLPLDSSAAGSGTSAGQRLVIDVEERRRDALAFGFRYDTREQAALLFTLSLRNRLAYGSTTRFLARLGQQTELGLDYFDHLGIDAAVGFGAGGRYTHVPVDLFGAGGRAVVRGDLDVYGAHAYVSRALADDAFIRVGLKGEHVRATPEVGADTLGSIVIETLKETFYSGALFLMADTRDQVPLPTRGFKASLKAEAADQALGSGATFRHYVADAELFLPASSSFTVFGRLALTRGRGSGLPPNYATFIGGLYPLDVLPGRFFPLYGAEAQELIGRSGQLALVGFRWLLREDVFVELVGNAGAAGDEWTLDTEKLRYGAGLTAGLLTLVGPVSITLAGDGLEDWPQVGFNLGYTF
ncbi:MAG: patatin-like phospholipase family protein [Rhodothermales bacterium]